MKDALLKEKGTSEKRALTLPNGKRARVHKLEVKLFFIVSNKSRNRLEAQKCIHRMKEFFWFVKEIWGGKLSLLQNGCNVGFCPWEEPLYLLFDFAMGNCELQQTEQGQDWS